METTTVTEHKHTNREQGIKLRSHNNYHYYHSYVWMHDSFWRWRIPTAITNKLLWYNVPWWFYFSLKTTRFCLKLHQLVVKIWKLIPYIAYICKESSRPVACDPKSQSQTENCPQLWHLINAAKPCSYSQTCLWVPSPSSAPALPNTTHPLWTLAMLFITALQSRAVRCIHTSPLPLSMATELIKV